MKAEKIPYVTPTRPSEKISESIGDQEATLSAHVARDICIRRLLHRILSVSPMSADFAGFQQRNPFLLYPQPSTCERFAADAA